MLVLVLVLEVVKVLVLVVSIVVAVVSVLVVVVVGSTDGVTASHKSHVFLHESANSGTPHIIAALSSQAPGSTRSI